jgi:hypothetical protein
MSEHTTHSDHNHNHGKDCSHVAVKHEGHVDYLHDGHLHHVHGDHIDEHTLNTTEQNPSVCTPEHSCSSHDQAHQHGNNCGHEAVPHSDHTDYLVDGHLHHQHEGHCDNHGSVELA